MKHMEQNLKVQVICFVFNQT